MSLFLSSSLLSGSSAFCSSNRGCFRGIACGNVGTVLPFVWTQSTARDKSLNISEPHNQGTSFRYFLGIGSLLNLLHLLEKFAITTFNLNLFLASAGQCLLYPTSPSGPKGLQCCSVSVLWSGKGYISMTCGSLHCLETAVGRSRWQAEFINPCHENLIHMKVVNCLCIKQAGLIHKHSGLNHTRIQAHTAHSELSFLAVTTRIN